MKRTMIAGTLLLAIGLCSGCNRSDRTSTPSNEAPPFAASQALPSQTQPQTLSVTQKPTSVESASNRDSAAATGAPSALSRGSGPTEPQDAILGEFDKTRDGTEFVATIATDKCGTIGDPQDCWQKKNVRLVGGAGFLDRTTLMLPDGSYMMLTFAFITKEVETAGSRVLSVGPVYPATKTTQQSLDETNPDALDPMEMKLNQRYRFGRKGNTIVYRDHCPAEVKPYQYLCSNYFLLLRECRGAIKECQTHDEPYSELIERWHRDAGVVGPEIWERGRAEQREWDRLNTPR